jgi:hypothetical protein
MLAPRRGIAQPKIERKLRQIPRRWNVLDLVVLGHRDRPGPWEEGRACPLFPRDQMSTPQGSDVDLFSYGESVVDLDA